MIDQTASLVSRVRAYYAENGFQSLVTRGTEKALWELARRRSVSRSEMKKIAAENDALWHFDQEEPISIAPVAHDVLEASFEPYLRQYTPAQPFVCELSDCFIIGPDAVGLTPDGRLIEETYPKNSPNIAGLGSTKSDFYKRAAGLRKKPAPLYPEPVVFPLISGDPSYYHWVVEYLPKLRLVEQYATEVAGDPTIVIESNPRKYITESLSVAGYSPDQYREWCGGERHVKRLVVPIHRVHRFNYQNIPASNYNPSREDLFWVRERMRSNIEFDTSESSKIAYISRQRAERGRKVLNYASVRDIVEAFGGETYVLEEMSFEEQVRVFAESGMIIGPHGAGLVNMIFADSPVVVELFPRTVLKPFFCFIADMIGAEYAPLVTESEGNNLVVDEETFRKHIRALHNQR